MTQPTVNVIFAQSFLSDVKHLKKKYRHVIDDVDLLVEQLRKGETPGDQIPNVGYSTYKVRSPILQKGKAEAFGLFTTFRPVQNVSC